VNKGEQARLYSLFCHRLQTGWLVDRDGALIIDQANQKFIDITRSPANFLLIATTNPIEFIASFMAGLRSGVPIFLGNPGWGEAEWARVATLTARVDVQQHQHTILIPTGGSSGEIKFAIHTWSTLSAAVNGFQSFYQVAEINSICILPLYHVSGLMQLVRSILTNGQLLIVDFQQLCENPQIINQLDLSQFFISLVPTQLVKLLDLDAKWLIKFQAILIGGSPASIKLLNKARTAQLPLALTYGMTETAAQITSLKPAEFLAGNNSCGRVLPHAKLELRLPDGEIQIAAKSLMLGYFPTVDLPTQFEPDDLGAVDPDGCLTILGRNSNKIITGGENVLPIEVVNAIMATGLVADAWVIGVPDRYWGQVVVAIYVENDLPVSVEILAQAMLGKISKYKLPKRWIMVDCIPRNALGKVLVHDLAILLRTLIF
jgi:o-succinylbenzoate---CoA ligase